MQLSTSDWSRTSKAPTETIQLAFLPNTSSKPNEQDVNNLFKYYIKICVIYCFTFWLSPGMGGDVRPTGAFAKSPPLTVRAIVVVRISYPGVSGLLRP
ncbi:hypothetical protein Trydic_g3336 [Trypoxylus dichotomus]